MKKLLSALIFSVGMNTLPAVAAPTWVFTPDSTPSDGAGGTIVSSDGVWELKVRVVKAADRTLSLGARTDSEKAVGGHAFVKGTGDLDMRGAVTRADASGEAWKIVHLSYGALGRGATGGFTEYGSFYAPTTLVSMDQCFCCETGHYQSFTNIVVDAPGFTTLKSQVFVIGSGVTTNLTRLVFKTPSLQNVPDNGFSATWANPENATQIKLWDTCWDDWDLTGVRTLGNGAFYGRHIRGTLDLPEVRTIGVFAFHQCTNVVRVLLSPERKQLELIDATAFRQNQWGTNRYVTDSTLEEVVMGGAFGFTIKTNAFNGQLALSSVSFTGAKPVYDINEGGIVFGGNNPEKTMAFYVPDNEEWAEVIAQATPATEEEKAAWLEAHPDYLPIWGVVPASVFHTQEDQYIGFWSKRVRTPEMFFDERFGDGATFESLGPYPAASDGSWPTNNTFRIKAIVGDGGTFMRWYGDMPKDLCGMQTIEVTGDRLVDVQWLLPRITHPWTFDWGSNTISNGIWRLHAQYASANLLTLGHSGVGSWNEYGRILTGTGSGYLDLGGKITDSNGVEYEIKGIQGGHNTLGATTEKPGPTVFLSPGTIRDHFFKYKHFSSESDDKSDLEVLVVDEPLVASGFEAGWLLGGTKVRRLQLLIPEIASLYKNAFNRYGFPEVDINFSCCDFAGVTNVGEQCFYFGAGVRGKIDLPSVKTVGSAAFYFCEGLEAAFLATNRTSAVTSMLANTFAYCRSLARIVVNLASGDVWSGGVTPDITGLKEVWFLGVPPTREGLSGLLGSLKETSGAKSCTVYGSRAFKSGETTWGSLADAPTETEIAAYDGERQDLVGVFRKDRTSSVGCAWIVQRASPWDPKGLVFIMR